MASDPHLKGQQKAVRLGRYDVLSRIATGGMGAVFRARDPETGRDLAIKLLIPEMAAKPAMLERFRREAHHAARLHHENIVKCYDLEEVDGKYFIPMEYVEGTDLLKYIEDNAPLDPELTRQVMIQACRALKHAQEQGIVHRDVKPSNFLLTHKRGQLVVKLTDFGLAREATNEEFRITRAGTTVGTVDYLSPEQACDSGSADVRSDLYSLGCTWFHMLTGHTPFSEGGLAERILAHLQEEPPDPRRENPRTSKALVRILHKLLAKKPGDRYQSPADLLQDLHSLDPISRRAKAADARAVRPADESSGELAGPRRDPKTAKRKARPARRDDTLAERPDTAVDVPHPRRTLWYVAGAAAVGLLLLVGAVGTVVAVKWLRPPAPDNKPEADDGSTLVTRPPPDPVIRPGPGVVQPPVVKPAELPALYDPKTPVNVAELRGRIDAAFPAGPGRGGEPLRLRRTAGEDGATPATLAGALAKAPPGPVTVEIHDNGPLFWTAAEVGNRDVVVRAAKGYRPLIVWDVQKAVQDRKASGRPEGARPYHFITVEGGRLHLEGVDVVVPVPDRLAEPLTLLHATDGDLSADGCTFSVSGRHASPVAVARLTAGDAPERRCRFTRCVLRGNSLQALDLDAPGGEVLFEDCLVAGAAHPLLQARGHERPATLRVVRSTFVGSESLLRLVPEKPGDKSAALNWLSWDAVLSRSGEVTGGELIVLPPGGDASRLKWEAINTAYAGWRTLLAGAESVSSDDTAAWRRALKWPEGDRAVRETWPPPQSDLAESAAALFRTANSPAAFATLTDRKESIGCAVDRVPPLRDGWKALAFERFVVPPFDVLDDATAPDIPAGDGQTFTGQKLDLSASPVDLGLFLQEMQHAGRLAPRVVLHIKGTGPVKMTPVKLKGFHLTLYFEQPAEEAKRIVVTLPPYTSGTPLPAAMLEVDGGLDVINGEFALPDVVSKATTASLFKVTGGDLRLYRCRLLGPHQSAPPANYDGLIRFDGSGQAAPDKARQCVLNECVLITDRSAVELHGVGARLLVKQCAVISGGRALHLDPGPAFKGRANVQCVLQNSSVAARRSLVRIDDAPAADATQEPVVIQSDHCAFLYPFRDTRNVPGLLAYGGDALPRGLFVWQSDADLFDRRVQYGCQSAAVDPPKPVPEWAALWASLFGSYNLTRPRTDVTLSRQFDLSRGWALEQLLLIAPTAQPSDNKPQYGADLVGNGFVKKAKRP
jgi:serine/threonine-protein kinase